MDSQGHVFVKKARLFWTFLDCNGLLHEKMSDFINIKESSQI